MSKEFLKTKTCNELRALAKEKGISGRWDMNKGQLIDAILEAEDAEVGKVKTKSAKDECKVDNRNNAEAESKREKNSASVEPFKFDMKQKMPYIESAEPGALVAFRLSNGKYKSAKVVKKSTKNRKLKVETSYGAEYIISFDDVIWVRTGKRWPSGVYRLLKGLGDNVDKEGQKVKA